MRGLISLVNHNHVDNNLKEILVYVYFGSIVNNRSKNASKCLNQVKHTKQRYVNIHMSHVIRTHVFGFASRYISN